MDYIKNLFGQDSVPTNFADLGKEVVKSGFTIGSAMAERVSNLLDDA